MEDACLGLIEKARWKRFWKVFRLVFERATSEKIDKRMNRQMRRVSQVLGKLSTGAYKSFQLLISD